MTMFAKLRLLSVTSCIPAALAIAGCSGSNPQGESTGTSDEFLTAPTCLPSLATGAVSHFDRALLDTVATTEGTRGHGEDGYNVTYAYHYFSSCQHHPDLDICAGGYCSTAAGRYQFLNTTWAGLGYPTFHPDNQDRGAMKLVARRGASVPANRAMTATEFVNTMDRISYEWASLPPGRYGQPSYTMSETRAKYCAFAGCDGSTGGGATGCHSDTLGKDVPDNTCVQSRSDGNWYQCDSGHWVDRWTDPAPCSSVHPL
jgi:muramidase (phage lysozyme)